MGYETRLYLGELLFPSKEDRIIIIEGVDSFVDGAHHLFHEADRGDYFHAHDGNTLYHCYG